MDMPVKNKVEEISLRPHEFMLPLFEAIVNSIISINSKTGEKGLITVTLHREEQQGLFSSSLMVEKDGSLSPAPITSIEIRDNGVGFDDDNFRSFNTAYSEKYKQRGCKGVGRFTMLACFKQVVVKSIYKKGPQLWERHFSFDTEREVNPKDGGAILLPDAASKETSVLLQEYHPEYKRRTILTTEDIAKDIIDHCLPFFLNKNAPTVILKDAYMSKEIVLNDILKQVVSFDGKASFFNPLDSGERFKIEVIKRTDGRMNRLKLCAHHRVVGKTRNLAILAPELEAPIKGKDGQSYFIDLYVTAAFLDKKVNSIRNSFNIADDRDDQELVREISMADIEKGVLEDLSRRYKDTFDQLHQETLRKVEAYILDPKHMRVGYRSLLSRPDLLKRIPFNASPDKIEEHLIRIKLQLEKELKQNLKQVLKKKRPEDYEEYSKIVRKYINQEAQFAKDKLADLVIHRKGVIDLIRRLIKLSKDNLYALEADLHNVIFPMGENIDTLPFEYHNLWLLDERLAFHAYVASDKTLRTNPHVALSSPKEADLLIFDFPWAFSEKDRELSSMVIFEFKRPGRDLNTADEKKLDTLVMKYFEDLMNDKARDEQGELLNLQDSTPKFGFIICDLDKGLVEYNTKFNEFRKTPHGTLYKIISPLNLHIEAMTYQQMLTMTEKRHQAFFKELGIDGDAANA